MKINLSSTSASAPKKVVTFLQAVFALKQKPAESIAASLTELSKEKALDSLHIDDFLAFARAAKQADIDKAIKSKAIQSMKPVLVAIDKNKTFSGKLAAIKKFKFKAAKPTTTSPAVKGPKNAGDAVLKANLDRAKTLQDFAKAYVDINTATNGGETTAEARREDKMTEAGIAALGMKDAGHYHEWSNGRYQLTIEDSDCELALVTGDGKKYKGPWTVIFTDSNHKEHSTECNTVIEVRNFVEQIKSGKSGATHSEGDKKAAVRSLNAASSLSDVVANLEKLNTMCYDPDEEEVNGEEVTRLVNPFMKKIGLKDVVVEHTYGDFNHIELYTEDLQVWLHLSTKKENVSIYDEEDSEEPLVKATVTTVVELVDAIKRAKAKSKASSPAKEIFEEYLMTLVETRAELKKAVSTEAKRLGIKAKVVAIRGDESGMGFIAKIAFPSATDKAKYDASYNAGLDDGDQTDREVSGINEDNDKVRLVFDNEKIKKLAAAARSDKANKTPRIWLAADRGIYLMYRPTKGNNTVVYALGDIDDDLNIAMRGLVGDGYFVLPISRIENTKAGTTKSINADLEIAFV